MVQAKGFSPVFVSFWLFPQKKFSIQISWYISCEENVFHQCESVFQLCQKWSFSFTSVRTHFLWDMVQAKGFSPVWVVFWFFFPKWTFWVNFCWHICSARKRCFTSLSQFLTFSQMKLFLNFLWHMVQAKLSTSVSQFLTFFPKWSFSLNFLWHMVQAKGFSPVWVSFWLFPQMKFFFEFLVTYGASKRFFTSVT